MPKLFNSLPRVLYPNQDPLLHLFIEAAATVFIQRPPVEVTVATVVGQIVRDSFTLGFQKPVSRILRLGPELTEESACSLGVIVSLLCGC